MSFWAKVFPDQPISETKLRAMNKQIMLEIMAHPQSFVEEAELRQRRRFGYVLIGLVTAGGAGILLLIAANGKQLWNLLEQFVLITLGYSSLVWLGEMWQKLEQLLYQLDKLRIGVETILAVYTWPLLGLSIALLTWSELRSISEDQ